MNVGQQLITAMEWLTVSTIQGPSPASVGKATLVTGCYVSLWVSENCPDIISWWREIRVKYNCLV